MEGKALFTLFFLFLSLRSLSSALPSFQTLIPNSLPPPASLPESEPDSSLLRSESGSDPGPDFHGDDASSLTLHLHHIDALSFNKTPEQLFQLRLERDSGRVNSIAAAAVSRNHNRNATHAPRSAGFSSSVVSGLAQGSGEYFTRLGIGTPAKLVYMVLDTGSDIVWLQCSPCRRCYSQSDPIFDPRKSGTYSPIPCSSPLCRRLDSSGCNSRRTCLYQVSYGDGSFTVGDFSTETLTFTRSRVKRVAVGCGHDNEGLFVGAAGLLGLGRGKLSFPSQTGRRYNRKFSYCLIDRSAASAKPSSVVFGDAAVSPAAIFTPLLSNPKLDTFYYVELLGISVGGTRIRGVTASMFKLDPTGNGGVIVDSGTSVTRLIRPAYIALRDAFRIGSRGLKRAPDFSLFDTCFDLGGETEVKVPTVVFHFRGGEVSLPATNYLIPVDNNKKFCFAFAGTMSGLSIIGNIQQQGFRVIYDLAGSRVGFAPRGCP